MMQVTVNNNETGDFGFENDQSLHKRCTKFMIRKVRVRRSSDML